MATVTFNNFRIVETFKEASVSEAQAKAFSMVG